jgi:hypothetical protein
MAGIGPPPKRPGTRQRRNKTVGGALLTTDGPSIPAPPLPDRDCVLCFGSGENEKGKDCPRCEASGVEPWHPLVLERWRAAWASPMAKEWIDSDKHGLFVLADLWDLYWKGDKDRASEIRLQEQRFGLSSLDRRRLQWEIDRVEQPKRPPAAPRGKRPAGDPRRFLRAVK